MSSRSASVVPEIEDETSDKVEPLYHVILLNDEDHTYDYVVEMLEKIFGMSEATAFSHAGISIGGARWVSRQPRRRAVSANTVMPAHSCQL